MDVFTFFPRGFKLSQSPFNSHYWICFNPRISALYPFQVLLPYRTVAFPPLCSLWLLLGLQTCITLLPSLHWPRTLGAVPDVPAATVSFFPSFPGFHARIWSELECNFPYEQYLALILVCNVFLFCTLRGVMRQLMGLLPPLTLPHCLGRDRHLCRFTFFFNTFFLHCLLRYRLSLNNIMLQSCVTFKDYFISYTELAALHCGDTCFLTRGR